MKRHVGISGVGIVLVALSWAVFAQEEAAELPATSCTACHASTDWFDEETIREVVGAFAGDAHAVAEISCHDCHGGNPDPALADDLDAAMDPGFEPNPYLGVPARAEIPESCGRCHSDPTFMRRYRPDPRVDQVQEYWTSRHGQALQAGDERVATCADCHGTHGVLGPRSPTSPVHPTNVAETCRTCHGDPEYMAGYTTDDGRPLPVDQYVRWSRSVHAAAMFEREDLTAPTCNDCHGNHGATPPGLDSIAFVCGQCHGREAELFRASSKQEGYEEHNALMEGADGCADCHVDPEPAAAVTGIHSFSECATCHGNHAVVRPTLAMLSPLPSIPCAFCHEGGVLPESVDAAAVSEPAAPIEPGEVQERYEERLGRLIETAEAEELEGEELYNWLVDRALEVPAHNLPGAEGSAVAESASLLRPEFERLFEKFRIGKTYFLYPDPVTGEPVRGEIRRCSDCHGEESFMGEPVGHTTSARMMQSMRELTTLAARAERFTLAAQRGGVLVEDASLAVDRAVDAQIQQEVLVHTFSAEEDGKLMEVHEEGMEQARAALELAVAALGELAFRRRGLAVTLGLILLVLVGLGLKIRQLGPP